MKKNIVLCSLLCLTAFFAIAQDNANIASYISREQQYGFIENKGQIHDQNYKTNSDVKYLLSIGNGMNLQLKANSFSYDTYYTEEKANTKDKFHHEKMGNDLTARDVIYHFHRVDVELIGASPNPQIIAEVQSADYMNYYNAVTPESGASFVRNFKKITYKDIYPGIDMIFNARAAKDKPVEYTFVVHPGADAGQIKLHYIGANETQLSQNKIHVNVAHGKFTESIPASWLMETNTVLDVKYRNIEKDVYGFTLSEYNKKQTLIIDPSPNLDWGTYYGGCSGYYAIALSCDMSGNVLVTGQTTSATGIATSGAHQTTLGGNDDAFIAKFNNNGVRLWGTYFGGSGYDYGYGIICDASGNVFITGLTSSNSGIVTSGAHQTTYGGNYDSFLGKFNSNGVRQWSTYYGGSSDDAGIGVTCDGSGNTYLAGQTRSTSAISTTGAQQTTLGGGYDNFIVKFNSSGVRQWGTYNGGAESEVVHGISYDKHGYIIITGYTSSTSGIATSGAHQTTYAGGNFDAFIVKFNINGVRQWGTYYGGSDFEMGNGISCDSNGNIYIIGHTLSTSGIVTSGGHQTVYGGNFDGFIAKFNANGIRQWGTYFGGTSYDIGNSIKSDINGNTFITGETSSNSFISTSGAHQETNGGGYDAFLAKFNTNGVRQYGTYYGGDSTDSGNGITCDENGNVFIIGYTKSLNSIVTNGAHQTSFSGTDYEAFIAKFSCLIPSTAGTITGSSSVCQGQSSVTYSLPIISNTTSYIWTLPSGATGSSSTNSIIVNYGTSAISGNITVKGLNLCGEGAISTKQITVNPLPSPAGSISGSNSVCQGQTITYSTPTIANATSYIWTLPFGATGSSTTNSITVNYSSNAATGNISVKGQNSCGNGLDSYLVVNVESPVADAGNISGDSIISVGENNIQYSVPLIAHATSYIWTLPAGASGTSSTNNISVNFSPSATPGFITVKGNNFCGNGNSSSLFINISCKHCPDSIISTTSGEFTHGCANSPYNNSSHCKWLLFPSGASVIYISFPEFDILPGDKIRVWQGSDTTGVLKGTFDNNNRPPDSITTTVPMLVELITNSTNVASGFKANYWTDVNGSVNETSDFIKSFNLYPNPAGKLLNIDFTCNDNDIELTIYNMLGQAVQNINMITADGIAKSIIDISAYPKGAYSVLIRGKNGNKAATFIIW